VLAASADEGWSVAVVPAAFSVTLPETLAALPDARREKVVPVTLATASLKVAVTAVPGLTFVALFAGPVELTVGGVVSTGVGEVTVMETEADLTSPWVEPELLLFPNQAAA
jgi:hypothetical protein